jgi:hypothetical protein
MTPNTLYLVPCALRLSSIPHPTSAIYPWYYNKRNQKGGDQMDLWRKIGVTIIFGIAAIVGGGLFWVLSEDWAVVFTYLCLVGFFLLAFLFNPEQIVNETATSEKVDKESSSQ